MRLSRHTIEIELQIFKDCDTEDKKLSYTFEMIKNAGKINPALPDWAFEQCERNINYVPFVMGILFALQLINEQELINQENELERLFSLE